LNRLFVNRSKEQPEQQTEELSNAQPDVVYGHMVPNPENNHAIPNDYEMHDTVVYSELKSNDNDNHAVAPSGDMYAQVHRST